MARSIKAATDHALQLQVRDIRIAYLEDRIRTHRRMVRDGWVSRWRPDREPHTYLWSALGDDSE
jgi:hypothetical protein